MLNALHEFVLDGTGKTPADDIPPIDDPRFSIAEHGRSRTVRRTWLDTFDWRLFRAGLTLELRAVRGASQLVLTGRDGELVAVQPTERIRWPSLIQGLPLGPLREQLAPVVGIRALLPVVRATSIQSERRALNTDDKTIATVVLDRLSVNGACAAPRIAITPLRGYHGQAAKLAEILAAAPRVRPAAASAFESAVSAIGRKPGDYTSKIDVHLTNTMPAALALATVLTRLFDTVRVNLQGTITDIDTEFLHDLRVAVRRTRSVLKSAGSALPDSMVARYKAEFKWLGDLTTPGRDLDVYVLGYEAMASNLVAATKADLEPFHQYLSRQRTVAHRHLTRGLRSERFTRLARQWPADLDKIAAAASRRPSAGGFAARRIAKAHQRVLRDGGTVGPTSPPEALHELRKRCKELRYLLEVFASLHDPAEQWRAVNELKALQDCLGEFQDTEVQRTELVDFATAMLAERSVPARTFLAMGEIAAALAVRQAKARGEFSGRFSDFASHRGRARIAALTEAAT